LTFTENLKSISGSQQRIYQPPSTQWHIELNDSDIKTWFTDSIKENMDSLYAVARRLTHNNTDCEDLVAESVAKAWSAIKSLDDRNRFRPWMFRILHNCFISDYRKKSVRPVETCYEEVTGGNDKEEVSNLLIKQPNEFLEWWGNPEKEFVNNLLGEDIMKAIEYLPESFRITVLLINLEGLSYDETAEVLGIPPGTVRSRMKRGRTLLQKQLWQHAQDAGLIAGNATKECTT
jgi:RNA polymerase sigma-70 factor (ECF subfamily)